MSTIAKLSVALVAKTAAFQAGMRNAGKSLSTFAGPAIKAGKLIGAVGAAATAAAIGGLALLTAKQFEAGDSLAKMGDRIGLATNRLAGLQLAAMYGGSGVEELNKGLLKMVKSIGDADRGMAGQKDAFDQLGLSIDALKKMDAEAQFRAIAERLNTLPSQTDRVNAAFTIFGKTGVNLLNTMRAGADGLDEAQKKAEAFGLAISRTDAAKLEEVVDRTTEVRQLFVGLARQIALKLAPFISEASRRFVAWATEGKGAAGIAERAMNAVKVAAGTVANMIQSVVRAWVRMKIAALEAREGLEGLWKDPKELVDLNRKIGDLERQLEALNDQDWGSSVIDTMSAIEDGAQAAAEQIANAATDMRAFDADAEEALAAAEEHANALKDLEASAKRVFEATRTPIEKYEQTITDLNELIDNQLIDFETYSRAVRQARDTLESATATPTEATRTANFRQVHLDRIALNGTPGANGRPAKVEDPQLKETNETLKSIDRNIREGQTARVG